MTQTAMSFSEEHVLLLVNFCGACYLAPFLLAIAISVFGVHVVVAVSLIMADY